MKKNIKLLLATLMAFGMAGAATACEGFELPFDIPGLGAESVPAQEYKATFVADGETVAVVTYKEGATSIEEPAVPEKEHYTGAWAPYLLNGNVTIKAIYTAVEYSVTFVADGVTVDTETYTVFNKKIDVPAVPEKADYTGAWEEYKLDGGNKTVNAVYTPMQYTVTFVADGETVDTQSYNVLNKEITVPAVPEKAGYTGAWAAYELNGNVVVEAVYTAIEYKVYFVHPKTGMQLCAPVTFTADTLSTLEFPAVPEDFATQMVGYTIAWDKKPSDLALEDTNVTPVLTAIEYTVTFNHPRTGMPVAAPITYTIENMSEVVFPEIPESIKMDGYTVAWDKTEADLVLGGLSVSFTITANTYTITYDVNGGKLENDIGTMEIVFGDNYELPVATPAKAYQSFLGWKDENGNFVAAEGTWEIASNVTLTAAYDSTIDFESSDVVPSFLSKTSGTHSLSIVELNGNKVLKMEGSTTNHGLNVTIDFLHDVFEDPNVQYLAFDAKSETTHHTNFRRSTIRTTGTIGQWGQEPYESDTQANEPQGTVFCQGIRPDAFKTFFFTRKDYNNWVSTGATVDMLISAGNFAEDENLYVDNIRPVTQAEYNKANYGLETGGIRPNGGNLLVYYGNTGGTWQYAITADDTGSGKPAFLSYGFTNDNVTEGNRALTFTKAAGQVTLRFNNTSVANFVAIANATGYYAFDLYVGEGSDAVITYPNIANAVIPGHTPNVGGWMTIYCQNDTNVSIKITDTTGGTYAIDNFRSVSAADYQAAQYGFEAGTMGLRLNLMNDEATHSGAAYVYYKGTDYSGTKASIAIAEGNAEGDVNALSNVRIDNTITHSGQYSLAFDKGKGYMYLTRHNESQAKIDFANGFTFWIYSTVEIDGVSGSNFYNGVNGKFNGGEGIMIPANTWTQITVKAEDIGNGRFLILQGGWSGTIYVDDFMPLN